MKITYLLLLIGSVITSSDNYFFDIIYNKEYEVDVNKFYPYNYIPANAKYYFTAKVEQDEKMQIEIKVLKNAIINFKLNICEFYFRPSNMQILYGHDLCRNVLLGKKDRSDDNYDIYLLDFEKIKDVNYLVIHIENFLALQYLSINLSKK